MSEQTSARSSTTVASATAVPAPLEASASLSNDQHAFWSPQVKSTRWQTIKQMLTGIALITCILWIALPIFWGSNWLLLRYFNRLTIVVVDFDSVQAGAQAAVGPVVTQMAYQTEYQASRPHLGLIVQDASQYPQGVEQVKTSVGYSDWWGGIIVYPNCTTTWLSSLETGNSSYDPTGCVGMVYAGARFYQIVLLYLVPYMQEFLGMAMQKASTQAVQTWLNNNAGSDQALNLAAAVPQALATPFSYFEEDLKPINQWAVSAPFEAALIYYFILSFQMAMWGHAARQKTGWGNKVTLPWLITWRIAVPMLLYVWVSLNFSLLFKAFLIPTSAALGNAGGFFALWTLNWLCLCACGLAMESMLALLTAEFAPFFLIMWIILNITSSFQPIELMETFYHFLYWTPFYNTIEAYKVLFYAVRPNNRLGQFYGVLIAVTAVTIVGMVVCVSIERLREEKQERKKLEEKEKS